MNISSLMTTEALAVYAGLTAINIMVFGFLLLRQRNKMVAVEGEVAVKQQSRWSVAGIEQSTKDLHDITLSLVTMVAPWIVPFVNAYLVGAAVHTELQWPVPVAIITGLAIELVGIQTVNLTLKIFDYELVRSKKPGTASSIPAKNRGDKPLRVHLMIGIGLSCLYFAVLVYMVFILEIYADSAAQYASLGMVGLTVASVISISLKSSTEQAIKMRQQRLLEVDADQAEKDAQKQTNKTDDTVQEIASSNVSAITTEPIVDVSPIIGGAERNGALVRTNNIGATAVAPSYSNGHGGNMHPGSTSNNTNGVHSPSQNKQWNIVAPAVSTTKAANGVAGTVQITAAAEDAQTAYKGLSPELQRLVALLHGEYQTQESLAETMGCNRSTINRRIQTLEDLGIISAHPYQGSKKQKWYQVLI